MLRFSARRVLDAETAVDLYAETFAQAFRSRRGFKGATEQEARAYRSARLGRSARSLRVARPGGDRGHVRRRQAPARARAGERPEGGYVVVRPIDPKRKNFHFAPGVSPGSGLRSVEYRDGLHGRKGCQGGTTARSPRNVKAGTVVMRTA